MKHRIVNKFGKFLMSIGNFRICIIDDEEAYFSENMLQFARNAGFKNIERHYRLDYNLFQDLQLNPRDIVVLDVQGIVEPSIAKDGVYVASTLSRNTPSFVAITSAHQYHLTNKVVDADYVIENRILTAVDFLDVLHDMVAHCIESKLSFYRKILFKTGYSLSKQAIA